MASKSCKNCYFYEECGQAFICGFFSPLLEVEWTDKEEAIYIERGRKEYRRRLWEDYKEEDRLQDYFG